MSEQDDTLIYGLEGANYAAGYAEGEQERDRLQSELDQLRQDVKPVLRAAEKVEQEWRSDGFMTPSLARELTNLADERATFRQQHSKED